MDAMHSIHCTAFEGVHQIASGELPQVALKVKQVLDQDAGSKVRIFDDATSELLAIDFRGSAADLAERLAGTIEDLAPLPAKPSQPRRRGRPRLGVVAREVTMLPQHWEWLNAQPGGASVALRRLVDEARRLHRGKDQRRRAQEVTFRFIQSLAADQPGYDDVVRALFAANRLRFSELLKQWPSDVSKHAHKLAEDAFTAGIESA